MTKGGDNKVIDGWGGGGGENDGGGGRVVVTHLLPEVKIPALLMLGLIPYMSQLPDWLKCYKGVGNKVGGGGGVEGEGY